MNKLKKEKVIPLIKQALKEDIGSGDVTTNSLVPKNLDVSGYVLLKEKAIIAGMDVFKWTLEELGKVEFIPLVKEGIWLEPGKIAMLNGNARAIITGERVALNFLQRMSGIATLTGKFVNKIKGAKAKILDTRKTTPLLRYLEKYAVKKGGGENHRFGLYDAVLIKDNHIVIAGGIKEALSQIQGEIEVKNLEELREALEKGANRILVDNMDIEEIREAVKITKGKAKIEVSGGVNLNNVLEIAMTGCDYISIGALTHSVKAIDISLEIVPKKQM